MLLVRSIHQYLQWLISAEDSDMVSFSPPLPTLFKLGFDRWWHYVNKVILNLNLTKILIHHPSITLHIIAEQHKQRSHVL